MFFLFHYITIEVKVSNSDNPVFVEKLKVEIFKFQSLRTPKKFFDNICAYYQFHEGIYQFHEGIYTFQNKIYQFENGIY